MSFPSGSTDQESACQCRRLKRQTLDPWDRKTPLEKGLATHSNILARRTPWTGEPDGLQSIELQSQT